MPSSDPTLILLAHDRWATRQIIDACAGLTDQQFHQTFEMGVGSLHNTITHILGAIRGWGDMLAGREQRERLEDQGPFTTDKLATLLDALSHDFATNAPPNRDGAEIVSGERGGKSYSFTRGAVLTHVATHGMHHRAQCCNMLRHLGQEGPWRVSVMEWTTVADPERPNSA